MNIMVCRTPYQILNGINILKNDFRGELCDLYVWNLNEADYREELEKSGVFREIHFYDVTDTYHFTGKNKIDYFKNYIHYYMNCEKIVTESFSLKEEKYDNMFLSFPGDFQLAIYFKYKKINPDLKLHMYEDGTFTYSFFGSARKFSLKGLFTKVFLGMSLEKEYKSVYTYMPEVCEVVCPTIEKRKIVFDMSMADCYNRLFNFNREDGEFSGREILFLDQPYGEDVLEKSGKILKAIADISGRDVTVKLHPRNDNVSQYDGYEIYKGKSPLEIINMNFDLSEAVFVSVISTACFTPKLIYDREPYIILLYKLINNEEILKINGASFAFAERVKKAYRNPERFFVPETEAELLEILKKL